MSYQIRVLEDAVIGDTAIKAGAIGSIYMARRFTVAGMSAEQPCRISFLREDVVGLKPGEMAMYDDSILAKLKYEKI